MRCFRCGNVIDDLKIGMVFWKERSAEGGVQVYSDFEICHKTCKPREPWEMCWEVSWFKSNRDLMEWMALVIPRAVVTEKERSAYIPESLIKVLLDLIKDLYKEEARHELIVDEKWR